MYERFRFATVDATEIARKHGIGSSAVVIVNTAIVGAYARLVDLPIEVIEETYSLLGLQNDLGAAQDAYSSVAVPERRAKGMTCLLRRLPGHQNLHPSHSPDGPHLGHAYPSEDRVLADSVTALQSRKGPVQRSLSRGKRHSEFHPSLETGRCRGCGTGACQHTASAVGLRTCLSCALHDLVQPSRLMTVR